MNNEVKTLKDLFYEFFQQCKNTPSDEFFSNGFMQCINTYFSLGYIYTVDSGMVGGQPFIGSGTSILIQGDTTMSVALLLPIVKSLSAITVGGETILANGISSALNLYFSQVIVECSVIGTLLGTSKGNVQFDTTSTLSTLILADFMMMKQLPNENIDSYNLRLNIGTDRKYKDSEECFADQLATHINSILENPLLTIINTNGQGLIEGSVGVGYWSFEEKEDENNDTE